MHQSYFDTALSTAANMRQQYANPTRRPSATMRFRQWVKANPLHSLRRQLGAHAIYLYIPPSSFRPAKEQRIGVPVEPETGDQQGSDTNANCVRLPCSFAPLNKVGRGIVSQGIFSLASSRARGSQMTAMARDRRRLGRPK